MEDFSVFTLVGIVSFALLTVALVIVGKKQRLLNQQLRDSQARIEAMQTELNALYSGAAGVGSHLAKLEAQVINLSDRQEQLDVRDPTTQNYNLAIDLVHQGAGVDELMRQCGLLHEEAELLVRLHGSPSL